MTSNLAIQEIPTKDSRFLRLADNSMYNPDIEVENAILEITPPGFYKPINFFLEPNFNASFNSSTLKISVARSTKELIALPDGVYKIKYSIKPNTLIYVEYDLLRTNEIEKMFAVSVCKLFAERAIIPLRDFEKRRGELTWIRELIDAAKYKVDECIQSQQGIELYNEAGRLLNQYNKCYCNV